MRSRLLLALLLAVAHFTAMYVTLRALVTATGSATGPSMLAKAGVALLAFPLFYTPLPALFGGRLHAGLYVAAVNALLGGGLAWALLRWRDARARRAADEFRA